MSLIVSRTPLRISLIGGSTDVPAFYEKHPGACVSFAIDKYVYIAINDKFDGRYRVSYSRTENVEDIDDISHNIVRSALQKWKLGNFKGLEIVSIADIPGEGSGLGSSSSFTVGLLNALAYKSLGARYERKALSDRAFCVEKAVHPNIGMQDHCAAAFGGFNKFEFGPGGLTNRIGSQTAIKNAQQFFLLLWTGITRKSEDILREQKDAFDSGRTLEIGKGLAEQAILIFDQLFNGQIRAAGDTIHAAWHLKRRLASGISNHWIDDLYSKAMNNGAWGGKLCGAGGGGFLFFIAPPDTHDRIVKATGLRKIDFNIDYEGSVIIKREGHGSF